MKAIRANQKGQTSDGRRIMDAIILSDTDPDEMPTSGHGIDGLKDDDVFAPFSILFVIAGTKVYIVNEIGAFTAL